MKRILKSQSLSIGLALFSMFFGAGNIIFPLAVGLHAGDKNIYAMMGLLLTAAVMPITGVIAMILFDGNYHKFFGRLGKIPGFLLALLIISLLGPLGSTPRCIALSYTTLKSSFPDLSPVLFSAAACLLIFLCTVKKQKILTLLGWILTPLLLGSLVTIIILGLIATPNIAQIQQNPMSPFFYGLKEGYNTMDLLAAFFFSSTIITILKARFQEKEEKNRYTNIALRASLIGAILLGIVYIGFSYLAVFHGMHLTHSAKDELLAAITFKIAGPHAAILVCIAIASACFTTAIALISAFADFIQKEVCKEKVRYEIVLFLSLLLTFFISTFEFTGISAFLSPTLQICYPGLIILTLLNIFHRTNNFKPIKVPVFAAFTLSAGMYFLL
ncbi:MAG: branched-chain amino acid transport system II carrier protein [Rhabdochlamydiaceae bacterium]|nr:branched-chain amino acid transport system II carrier protein [Rhabdochlamydiaceae bacterium]